MTPQGNIIAIPTYNRRAEVEACLDCLASVEGLDDWRVIIRDDCSTDYDIADLLKDRPFSATVLRSKSNGGCDRNTVLLLRACLAQNAGRVLLLDSDMIVSRDILRFADRVFANTDGVLSLYNSVLHDEGQIVDDDLVLKDSIGGAATLWDASVLGHMLEGLDGTRYWDWQFCDRARERNIRIFVVRKSRAQHIGIEGSHSVWFGQLDYGVGFRVDTAEQAAAIAIAHDKLMLSQSLYALSKKPLLQRWRRSIAKRLPKKRAAG
ncbi:glycosyltransferase family A protein [Nitratireductor sp. XY-223]|uniref:glycosyltransferase family A protein n=1 Tax=Nitratireductor sp. XY-223 TaxID=2561926 RepID=UPI0010A9FB69|nr:glycosyltransferase family A protein [Nitratireductor sp. XY-223]